MTLPLALDDGRLRVPASGRGPGDLIVDGFRDIGPDDADYDDWVAYMQASGRPVPSAEEPAEPAD